MLRVPTKSPRVESRAVDASVNAYLGAALVLAAGLDGIARELDPGPPIDLDMYVQSDDQIAELGVELLPRTLSEAIDAFEADPLTLEVFGSDLHPPTSTSSDPSGRTSTTRSATGSGSGT